jgi:hypothetical protein
MLMQWATFTALYVGYGAALLTAIPLTAQQDPLYEVRGELSSLDGAVRTYYADGSREMAMDLQEMLTEGLRFYETELGVRRAVELALLGPAEWRAINPRSPSGAPYSGFLPGVTQGDPPILFLPSEGGHGLEDLIRRAWEGEEEVRRLGIPLDQLTVRYTVLVGFHELGHVVAREVGAELGSPWADELLATYLAYAFLRVKYPMDAQIWQLVSTAFVRQLDSPRKSLDDIASGVGVEGYVWYQGSLQLRAAEVWEVRGFAFLQDLQVLRREGLASRSAKELVDALEVRVPGFKAWAERYHELSGVHCACFRNLAQLPVAWSGIGRTGR